MSVEDQPVANDELAALFPNVAVEVAELWGRGDPSTLHPDEQPLIASAVENRRREFAAGRQCVRLAMERLGRRPEALLIGERRSPLWPDDVIGSISHTEGYAVAVVGLVDPDRDSDRGRDAALAPVPAPITVGIDAEHVGRVLDHLHDRLFTPAELERLAALSPADREVAATVMFGAKEAFYKAQFVRTAAWVGFHDVELRPDGDTFTMHRATDLDVLDAFEWPMTARSVVRRGIAISAVEARSG